MPATSSRDLSAPTLTSSVASQASVLIAPATSSSRKARRPFLRSAPPRPTVSRTVSPSQYRYQSGPHQWESLPDTAPMIGGCETITGPQLLVCGKPCDFNVGDLSTLVFLCSEHSHQPWPYEQLLYGEDPYRRGRGIEDRVLRARDTVRGALAAMASHKYTRPRERHDILATSPTKTTIAPQKSTLRFIECRPEAGPRHRPRRTARSSRRLHNRIRSRDGDSVPSTQVQVTLPSVPSAQPRGA